MAGQITLNGYSDTPFNVYRNTFIRDGYEFVCWNTKKDGTGTNINPSTDLNVQTDTTLYAQWKLVYKYMQLQRSGSLTIDNNTTKFSTDSYEYTPVNVDFTKSNALEIVLKITVPDSSGSADTEAELTLFTINPTDKIKNFSLTLLNSHLIFKLTSSTSTKSLTTGSDYYVKFNKNATSYSVSISTDGTVYEQVLTGMSDELMTGYPILIGKGYSIRYLVSEAYAVQVATYKTVTTTGNWVPTCWVGRWSLFWWGYPLHVGWWGHGYYQTITKTVFDKYVNETRYRNVDKYQKAGNFKGTIDFKESYIILNNIKYKLKA